VDRGEQSREEVLMEVFDHKKVPVDMGSRVLRLKRQGRAHRSLPFALSRASLSSVKGSSPSKRPTSCIGAKNGSNAKSKPRLLPPSPSMASHFPSGQVGLRSRFCPVSSHGARGGEDGTANKAVHVCLRDERGLDNVLPVPLASGCQALPSAATAYTG